MTLTPLAYQVLSLLFFYNGKTSRIVTLAKATQTLNYRNIYAALDQLESKELIKMVTEVRTDKDDLGYRITAAGMAYHMAQQIKTKLLPEPKRPLEGA